MNQQEYLKQLEKYLKKLPAQDYTDAMEYFTEYFSETDEAGAQQLMQELGSPKEAAQELIANLLDQKITDDDQNTASKPHHRFHAIWLACLVILAAPIGLPLSIALIILLLVLLLCAAIGIVCLFLLSVAFLLGGGKLIVDGIGMLAASLPGFALESGMGLLLLGGGILGGILGYYICKGIGIGFIKLAQRIAKKGGHSI